MSARNGDLPSDASSSASDNTPTTADGVAAPARRVPERVGPYRILRELGRGGVGRVYLAEQDRPVRRQVAIKLIQAGAASDNILKRFESERQAMALLNHPNIAHIYDAGTSDEGFSYIAMEYVPGEPITDHAERRSLGLEARLDLFLSVCDGIQHAHQKGILHRDIKPSNVLVADIDDGATPKIIDFGLAKAVGFALTEDPLHTRQDLAVGTPAYMAPEQLIGDGADTRSDVYALGVLLYQLLTGEPPVDPTSLTGSSALEIARVLLEEVPERPSRRLARRLDEGEVEPALADDVQRALRTDLDWVVLKALEKDPDRRYGSARDLAADVKRYLHQEPVTARQPTLRYRVGKYLRRHAWLIAGTTVAVTALTLTFAWGFQRSRAEAARANREAATAEQVSDFLVELFEVSDPGQARGESVTARELLDRGAERIATELVGQPLVQARLLDTMGTVYVQLGLYQRAEETIQRAVQLYEVERGDSEELALSLEGLAWVHFQQGRYQQAVVPLERSLSIRERILEPGNPLIGESLNNLAALHRELGNHQPAEELYRRSIALLEGSDADGATIAYPIANLATVLHDQERYQAAEPLHLRALQIRLDAHGPNHPEVALSYNDVGWFYYLTGDYQRAEDYHLRCLELERELYDPEHPTIALSLNNLGLVDLEQGELDSAEDRFNRALAMRRKRLQPDHPNIAESLQGLGRVAAARGDRDRAIELLARALEILERSRGADHRDAVEARELLRAAAVNPT